jgi:polynucleotide 5'-hydroxyl-kinase GRC3/NOL9
METSFDTPESWKRIELDTLRGLLIVIGGTDSGKSSFCGYLTEALAQAGISTALLDGDPGQSRLGPPATLTLRFDAPVPDTVSLPFEDGRLRRFIGGVTPAGHMLQVLTAASRLVTAARICRAETIVYDTSGFIDSARGGASLKLSKIDLLKPSILFALQRHNELEPLLAPLRRSRRARLIELEISHLARTRSIERRRAYRVARFAEYFSAAKPLTLPMFQYAVFPAPEFRIARLASFEDAQGYSRHLGIVLRSDFRSRTVTFLTPMRSPDEIDAIRLGKIQVDPATYSDAPL